MLNSSLLFNALPELEPKPNTARNALWFSLMPANESLTLEHLSDYEQAQYNKRKQASAKAEYLSSRWLIKALAKHYLPQLSDVPFSALNTQFIETEKSLALFYHQQRLDIRVVISHSKQHVAVCISGGKHTRLGLDIEYTKKQRDFKKLAAHFYHPSEAELIGEQSAHFFRIWTLKEAYAKASQQSIASLLSQPILPLLASSELKVYCGLWQDFDVSLLSEPQRSVYKLNSSTL